MILIAHNLVQRLVDNYFHLWQQVYQFRKKMLHVSGVMIMTQIWVICGSALSDKGNKPVCNETDRFLNKSTKVKLVIWIASVQLLHYSWSVIATEQVDLVDNQ